MRKPLADWWRITPIPTPSPSTWPSMRWLMWPVNSPAALSVPAWVSNHWSRLNLSINWIWIFALHLSHRRLEGTHSRLDHFKERTAGLLYGRLQGRTASPSLGSQHHHGLHTHRCGGKWHHNHRLLCQRAAGKERRPPRWSADLPPDLQHLQALPVRADDGQDQRLSARLSSEQCRLVSQPALRQEPLCVPPGRHSLPLCSRFNSGFGDEDWRRQTNVSSRMINVFMYKVKVCKKNIALTKRETSLVKVFQKLKLGFALQIMLRISSFLIIIYFYQLLPCLLFCKWIFTTFFNAKCSFVSFAFLNKRNLF